MIPIPRRAGRLAEEITRLARSPLLVADEVNEPFSGGGEILGA